MGGAVPTLIPFPPGGFLMSEVTCSATPSEDYDTSVSCMDGVMRFHNVPFSDNGNLTLVADSDGNFTLEARGPEMDDDPGGYTILRGSSLHRLRQFVRN